MRSGLLLLLALATASPVVPARAQEPGATPPPHPGESLRVYLLTMGRGDLIWEKFGHNAIRIVDEAGGTDVAWNWGMFSFEQANFWPRLIRGEMLYYMAGYPTDRTLREYVHFDRAVWSQELALTAEQKWRLHAAVLEHDRPENRQYRYHYYRDNCSTRVRDMLDLALGGALRAELSGDTTDTTFRWHTRRLLGDSPLAYAGIQLVLGNRADRAITEWEEAFLPLRLQAHLREVRVPATDGGTRPLVVGETSLVESARPPAPGRAPSRLGWFAGIGLLFGGLVALLAARARAGGPAARLALVGLAGGWSLLAGVGGLLIAGAWLFTAHDFWASNENLLQTDPLSLLLAAGLLPLAWRRRLDPRVARLAEAVAVLSVAGFLLQAFPGLDQVNGEIIALALPANLSVAWAARLLAGREPPPAREPAARAA